MRPKLTYANAMATIAVFIALGGASYAALKLPKNSVGTKQLKRNAVTAEKIKANAVSGVAVQDGSLTGADINATSLGTVPSAKVAGAAPPVGQAGGDLAGTFPSPQLKEPEAWHEVSTFETCAISPVLVSWEFAGGELATPAYYRDPYGIVHLKGSVKCPESPAFDYRLFRLPPGFRPPGVQYFPIVVGYNEAGAVAVLPSGDVNNLRISSAAASQLSIDSVRFRCDPSGVNGCP